MPVFVELVFGFEIADVELLRSNARKAYSALKFSDCDDEEVIFRIRSTTVIIIDSAVVAVEIRGVEEALRQGEFWRKEFRYHVETWMAQTIPRVGLPHQEARHLPTNIFSETDRG